MCLTTTITKKKREKLGLFKLAERGYGWKVFYKNPHSNKLEFKYHNYFDLKINKWMNSEWDCLTSKLKTIRSDFSGRYRTGFHIFLRKKDAEMGIRREYGSRNHVIKKVEFKNIVAYGYESSVEVIVAKDMYIY
ncbi:MAG: hypothetical protein V1663_04045 [archaeon]